MTARPIVQVYSIKNDKVEATGNVPLAAVFTCPIRLDVVQYVHSRMNKNHRQAYAVSEKAGHQTSAESWGTGRAVARIPRVAGGGTHRAGQGAFGNMCRGGRMFAPTKTWRRWHVKINVNQKRFAVCAALAATAIPALVMARGHRVEQVAEIPLVVSNESIDSVVKTSKAVTLLKTLKALDDVDRVKDSRKVRPGKGKMRNRRYVQKRGPLVVFNEKSDIVKAFRNLPGVELVNVKHLNLLQLAPGGHLGRFVIWTKDAFEKLDSIFGTYTKKSGVKRDFVLPRPLLSNADLGRIINSDEVQSAIRPVQKARRFVPHKRNPLVNIQALVKLNPYAQTLRRKAIAAQQKRDKKTVEVKEAKKKGTFKAAKPTAKQQKLKKLEHARKKNRPTWAAPLAAKTF